MKLLKSIKHNLQKAGLSELDFLENPQGRTFNKKNLSNGLIGKATRYLWRHSWPQFVGISAVIAFLLFFLHLFLTSAYITQRVSGDITQRLGFYFYISEPGQNGAPNDEDAIFERVMALKGELEGQGLGVEYYSKEDALKMLQTRIPGVIQNFERYGIANPLPATMYVTFDDNDEFNALSGIISNYKEVVRNAESIQTRGGFAEQQQRISNIINITNFSTAFSVVLIVVVSIMIITFLLLIIAMKCRQFRKNIEIEKLLGANYMTIKMPFLLSIIGMLIMAFAFTTVILLIIVSYVGASFTYLFHTSLISYATSIGWGNIILILLVEFIVLTALSVSISDKVLTNMIRKI